MPVNGIGAAFVVLSVGTLTTASMAATITFDDLQHGEIVFDRYQSSHGVTIVAQNPNRSFDLGIAFDSSRSGTADPDLEGPWSGGNLASGTILGRMLIIAENNVDANNDGLIDSPDDEGSRPAGSLRFEFDGLVDSFGLDLVDIDSITAELGSLEFSLGGDVLATMSMADLATGGVEGILYDGGPSWGDNSANRISAITAANLGISAFDSVTINLGGSGAIDNVIFTSVPAPGALAMFALVGLAGRRRRA